jgi:hypothetical protein
MSREPGTKRDANMEYLVSWSQMGLALSARDSPFNAAVIPRFRKKHSPRKFGGCTSPQFHIPVGIVDERLPGLVLLLCELKVEQWAPLRLFRLADQGHIGLPWGATALADVAIHTRTDDIVPRRPTTLAPRDYVVQAQFAGGELLPAVLALVVVSRENVTPVELHSLLWQLVVGEQPDNSWSLDLRRRRPHPVVLFLAEMSCPVRTQFRPGLEVVGVELTIVEAHDLGQFLAEQAKGSADGDNMYGNERLVQHQHTRIQGRVRSDIHNGAAFLLGN